MTSYPYDLLSQSRESHAAYDYEPAASQQYEPPRPPASQVAYPPAYPTAYPPAVSSGQPAAYPPAVSSGQAAAYLPAASNGQPAAYPPSAHGQPAAYPPSVSSGQPAAYPPSAHGQPAAYPPAVSSGQAAAFLPAVSSGQPAAYPPAVSSGQPAAYPPSVSSGQQAAYPPSYPPASNGQPAAYPPSYPPASNGQPAAHGQAAASHTPRESAGEMRECPHQGCGVQTRYMDLHLEHVHKIKFWGYRCRDETCRTAFNAVRLSHLREHWDKVHDRGHITDSDLAAFKVDIPEGYYDVVKCHLCSFNDFTDLGIKQHMHEKHYNSAIASQTYGPPLPSRIDPVERRPPLPYHDEQYLEDYAETSGKRMRYDEDRYHDHLPERRDTWHSKSDYGYDDHTRAQTSYHRPQPQNHKQFQTPSSSRPRKAEKEPSESGGKQQATGLGKRIICPIADCGRPVADLNMHYRRRHERKFHAYRCSECMYETSNCEGKLFRNHRVRSHGRGKKDDIEPFLVHIPEGYIVMPTCDKCPFLALTQGAVDKHLCQPQNFSYDYAAATAWDERWDGVKVPRFKTLEEFKAETKQGDSEPKKNETKQPENWTLPRPSAAYHLLHPVHGSTKKTIEPTDGHERCPKPDCNALVLGLQNHRRRWHKLKYKGYECPHCTQQFSILDRSFLRQHLWQAHEVKIEVLADYEIAVADGYYDLYQCSTCKFRALTEAHIKKHVLVCPAALAGTAEDTAKDTAAGTVAGTAKDTAAGTVADTAKDTAAGTSADTGADNGVDTAGDTGMDTV